MFFPAAREPMRPAMEAKLSVLPFLPTLGVFQFRNAVHILQGFPSGPMTIPGGSLCVDFRDVSADVAVSVMVRNFGHGGGRQRVSIIQYVLCFQLERRKMALTDYNHHHTPNTRDTTAKGIVSERNMGLRMLSFAGLAFYDERSHCACLIEPNRHLDLHSPCKHADFRRYTSGGFNPLHTPQCFWL